MLAETREQIMSWLGELFTDDVAQKMDIQRAAMARGYGLEPTKFTRPYPGSSVNVNMQQRTSLAGGLAKTALALVTGAGLTAGAMALLSKPDAAAPTATTNVTEDQYRARVFWGDEEITPETPGKATVPVEQ